MNPYDDLRRHARQRRDRDIQAARERYADTIDQIYLLQARNGQRSFDSAYYNRGVRFFSAQAAAAIRRGTKIMPCRCSR